MQDEENKPKKKEMHWLKEWLVYGTSSILPLGQLAFMVFLMIIMAVFLRSCD